MTAASPSPRAESPSLSAPQSAAFDRTGTTGTRATSIQASLSRVVTLVLIALIAIGIVLRIHALGFPSSFTFDEELFAHNAHNYLLGLRDDNDHPPLGKLLMAVGLLLFGYNSLGWRFVSLCFGLQNLLVGYWLGRTLFGTQRSGLFAAAFLAGDGFFIAYSRVGLLDGMLTCLVLCSVIAASTARGVLGVLRAALLVGLATSIKWSGALAIFPCLAACLLIARVRSSALLAFVIVPLVHVAIWSFGLRVTGQASDLHSLWKVMSELFRHHLELGHHQNAAASPWYTWPVMGHPIVVKLSQHGRTLRYASSVGNPLLFVAASLTVVLAFVEIPFRFFHACRRSSRVILGNPGPALVGPSVPLAAPSPAGVAPSPAGVAPSPAGVAPSRPLALWRPAIVLQVGWLALLFPWMVARGSYTFMYHYLPSYGFALVLLAGCVARFERKHVRQVLCFTAAALILTAYFAPVWGELPISESAANQRLLFRAWRP